jgi:beta-N-acetylhexosaminidase
LSLMAFYPAGLLRLLRQVFFRFVTSVVIITSLFGCTSSRRTITKQDVSLDVKIGQMLMVGFRGLRINENSSIVRDIQDYHLGGIILFDYDVPAQKPVRNIESFAQVRELVASLQDSSATPLLVAIDQEGGKITRLKESSGFPATVSAQYLGTMNSRTLTYEHAANIAKTLAELGINLNLVPCVDLNINPDNPVIGRLERSFSAEANIVTKHALAFIEAHQKQGILCAIKHFPGHGSSAGDSHLGLVNVTDTWSPAELKPYKNIIKAGMADAIMTAHVFNAHFDDKYPATLSKPIISGILRKQLDYDGVVISDDMQMQAITSNYGFEAAIQAAIEAGVDIILIANNSIYEEDIVTRSVEVIKKLVRDGKISEERINKSYQRIQKLKSKIL